MLLDAGNDFRMRSLNQQCSDPTDKRSGVADDSPRDRVGAE
jgi:hypothetical protein